MSRLDLEMLALIVLVVIIVLLARHRNGRG
jgi:hypothetical protein